MTDGIGKRCDKIIIELITHTYRKNNNCSFVPFKNRISVFFRWRKRNPKIMRNEKHDLRCVILIIWMEWRYIQLINWLNQVKRSLKRHYFISLFLCAIGIGGRIVYSAYHIMKNVHVFITLPQHFVIILLNHIKSN